MDIGTLLYQDIYIRQWMEDIKHKYHRSRDIKLDKKVFEGELKRPIKEYEYQQIVHNIIPIMYNLMLFILLLIYFIKYTESEMTKFEYIYGIILCLIIGGSFAYFIYHIYSEITSKGKETLEQVLSQCKIDPSLDDLYGTWIIDNDIHACLSFTLKPENKMDVDITEMHKLSEGCCSHEINDIYDSRIVGAVQLPLKETKLRKGKPLYYRCIDETAYKFVLHKNGIIKFVPINEAIINKISLARLDSQGWFDTLKNIKHANKYSCFCLGILTKDNKIKRYNRWNSDLQYFYTANKQ